jgi:hypothetical protein
VTYILCPDGAWRKVGRWRDNVLRPRRPNLAAAKHSVQRKGYVVLQMKGFLGEFLGEVGTVDVEFICRHCNSESQYGSQRKNDHRFHDFHGGLMLLSLKVSYKRILHPSFLRQV